MAEKRKPGPATRLPPARPEWFDLPDDQLGVVVYAAWATPQLKKLGIDINQLSPASMESLRLALLDRPESDSVVAAVEEKLLRVIALGDPARGGKMYREWFDRTTFHIRCRNEATSLHKRQRENAKKPRPDALTVVLTQIMTSNPKIKDHAIVPALRRLNGKGVIMGVTDAHVFFNEPGKAEPQSAPLKGLKFRARKIRKNLLL